MHACAGHSVEFYDDDKVLVVSVTDHIRPALGQRGAAVVIATPEHRAAFQRSLRGRGADVDAALRDGRLQMLDAAETLACFTDGDGPDAERFVATVGPVLDRAEAAAGDGPVRAYGEMVALLWQDGQARMALELEDHWNDLGEQRAFELMCAYPMDCFAGEIHAAGFARVCEQHDVVVPAHRPTDARDSGRLIAGLQQQVWGLRSDIARDPTTGAASRRHF